MHSSSFPTILCLIVLVRESIGSELTALNASSYAYSLYRKLRTEDAPSDRDEAVLHARIRKRVCKELATSGFFPIIDTEVYQDLFLPKYSEIFHQIYTRADSVQAYQYENPYRVREIVEGDEESRGSSESLFICLSRDSVVGEIVPFFVSKEYNVAPPSEPYKPGRFLFTGLKIEQPPEYHYVILAEEPSSAWDKFGFNVEIYFLHARKYMEAAESNDIDPLCKLVSEEDEDAENQHYRFCVAISTSLPLRDGIHYPTIETYDCEMVEISFRTPAAREAAAGRSYYERLIPCICQRPSFDEREIFFYISRAYQSNKVLVYAHDSSDGKVYLESLYTNIAIQDELNSFDLIED